MAIVDLYLPDEVLSKAAGLVEIVATIRRFGGG